MPHRIRRFVATMTLAIVAVALAVAAPAPSHADAGEYYYNAGRRIAIVRSTTRVATGAGRRSLLTGAA